MDDFMEKRQNFRVDMINDVPATAKIFSISNKKIEIEKTFPITVLDISSSGMRAIISIDMPVEVIIINAKFEFENELFNFNAQIIRKTYKDNGYEYGMKFIFNNPRDESRITRCLNQYKIKHARFKKIELDLRKQKYLGSFVKMLELIKEPAYLITHQRIVVAMNQTAREKGGSLGERCYLTVGKRHKVCPHCRLEEALKVDHIVDAEAYLLDKRCTARWLLLEDELAIHYYMA